MIIYSVISLRITAQLVGPVEYAGYISAEG